MAVSIADTKYGDSQVSSTSPKERNDGADAPRTQSAVTGKELLQWIKQDTKCLQHFRGWTVSENDQIRSPCDNHNLRELYLSRREKTEGHPWDGFLRRMDSGRSNIKQLPSPEYFPAHKTHWVPHHRKLSWHSQGEILCSSSSPSLPDFKEHHMEQDLLYHINENLYMCQKTKFSPTVGAHPGCKRALGDSNKDNEQCSFSSWKFRAAIGQQRQNEKTGELETLHTRWAGSWAQPLMNMFPALKWLFESRPYE